MDELNSTFVSLPKVPQTICREQFKTDFLAKFDKSEKSWKVPKEFEEKARKAIEIGHIEPDIDWNKYDATEGTLARVLQDDLRSAAKSAVDGWAKFTNPSYGLNLEWKVNRGGPTWGIYANIEIFQDPVLPGERNFETVRNKFIFKAPLAIAHKGKLAYIFYAGGLSSSIISNLMFSANVIHIRGLKQAPSNKLN